MNQADETFIQHRCIVCGGTEHEFVYRGWDRVYQLDEKFSIYECVNCNLYTTHPILSSIEINKFYPENYFCYVPAIEDESNVFLKSDRQLAVNKRIRIIKKKTIKQGRILDIGCSTGVLLNGLHKQGWECVGLEPNKNAATYAQERFGLTVINDYLENFTFPDESFDVVSVFDVLEHIENPTNFLAEIYRILKPGGWLIGTLPNADSLEKKIFKEYWVGWDIPRHYRTFNPKNMKQFLINHNFKNVEIFSFYGRHGMFILSLKFWLDSWTKHRWAVNIIQILFGSIIMRVLLIPIFVLLEKLNKSTAMAFVAKKS